MSDQPSANPIFYWSTREKERKKKRKKRRKRRKNKNKLYYIVQANNPTHPARTLPGRPWPVRPKVK
jgi:hypothetical protein